MDLLRGSSVHCTLSDENICPPHSSQAVNVTTISYYSLYLTALQSFVTWRPHLDRELRKSRPWVLFIFVSPAFDRVSGTYFLGGSDGKESVCNAGDLGLTPGSGRSLGEVNGNPLQYSCLGNPMDIGAWRAIVHEVAKSPNLATERACMPCPKVGGKWVKGVKRYELPVIK